MAFLEAAEVDNEDEIKEELFMELITEFDKQHCQHTDNAVQGSTEQQSLLMTERSCHLYKDLARIFEETFSKFNELKNRTHRYKEAKFLVYASFGTTILLLILKVIALMKSNSMALLTSFMDNLLDCLSGIILLLSAHIAKKGITQGMFQSQMHLAQIKHKYIYANRFENLGVLIFAVMMGTISALLIKEGIEEVISISNHEEKEMRFDGFSQGILIFNVIIKLILCIWCWLAARRSDELVETLKAYRDDHRNDTISNLIGLIGATLSGKLGGDWRFCDPVCAILLCMYILINWSQTAIEQIQSFSGKAKKEEEINEFLVKMICCFEYEPIKEIKSINCYESAENVIIEMIIKLDSKNLDVGHTVCQALQNQFEEAEGVERCFVHIEGDK